MALTRFPDAKITPTLTVDVVARAERDVHSAAADLILLAADLETVDQVLAVSKKVIGMRAALDSVASFLLARGEELTR